VSRFGAPLSEKTSSHGYVGRLRAEAEAAFHLAFYVAELTGRAETNELSEDDALFTAPADAGNETDYGKQAVMVASEVLEAFGGAGYVEDTGLPQLLRDAQGPAHLGRHHQRPFAGHPARPGLSQNSEKSG